MISPCKLQAAEAAALMLASLTFIQKYLQRSTRAQLRPPRTVLDQYRLRRVLDYIADSVSEEITLEKLASIAGYSAFHFCAEICNW